jgi:hypothetical protein
MDIIRYYTLCRCPYCNITLKAHWESLDQYKRNGASFIAVSPMLPDKSSEFAENLDVKYDVLSDVGNEVAKKFGLVFQLNDEIREIWNEKFKVDFKQVREQTSHHPPADLTLTESRCMPALALACHWLAAFQILSTSTEPCYILSFLRAL